MYGVYPRGWGKCVTGDTLIYTNEGIKEIGEYFNYCTDDGEFWEEVNDLGVINRYGKLENVSSLYYGGYKPTKKIITEYNYNIEGTLEHPLLIMNTEGKLEWKKIGDIKVGDYVVINRNNDSWGNNVDINIKKILKSNKPLSRNEMNMSKDIAVDIYKNISENVFFTTSEKKSIQLQIILLNLGVVTNRRKIDGKWYVLIIDDTEIDDYLFTKVTDIENSSNYVYDISLLDTHSFVANGIISHNTFNEVVMMYVSAVLYPGIEFALTAQTKENAAELLKDKHSDILKKYPWFKHEVLDKSFTKSDAEVLFVNGSRIDILANNQSSKGQRRHQIMIEESALLDDFTFQDALFPIVEHGRLTAGKLGINNPEELSQKVSFFTTAGFRGSDEYERNLRMMDDMVNLNGKIVIGSDWKLGCWYGRGSTKKQILDKKKNMTPIAFGQNYESKWVGAAGDALVDIKKVLALRTLTKPEIKGDGISEYYLSMDVARSNNTSNNQSAIAVFKVIRNKETHRIKKVQLVNMIYVPNFLNFTAQAIQLKRVKYLYNAKIVVIDENGLGVGIKDELLKEHIDPITGDFYPCWDTINTEDIPDNPKDAEKCLFALSSQGINSDIIVNFIDTVEGGKLELLVKHDGTYKLDDEHYINTVVAPMAQTDLLVEELSNLKLEHKSSGRLDVKQLTKRVDKDRYSAVAYGLYYIMKYENNTQKEIQKIDVGELLKMFKKPQIRA